MVRTKKINWRVASVPSTLLFMCGAMACAIHAAEFYTIIGPDSRPMVVPRVTSEIKKTEVHKQVSDSKPALTQSSKNNPHGVQAAQAEPLSELSKMEQPQHTSVPVNQTAVSHAKPLAQKPVPVIPTQNTALTSIAVTELQQPPAAKVEIQKSMPVNRLSDQDARKASAITVQQSEAKPALENVVEPLHQPATIATDSMSATSVERALHQVEANMAFEKASRLAAPPNTSSHTSVSNGFLEVNGERYVKNEYLEGQEFNLENKKRFYVMPEGVVDKELGAPRLQVIEREKGVNKGVLNRLFNTQQKDESSVITLSTQYYPIAKEQVVQSLGQACYRDKKIQKAKVLKAQQDVNVWARQPLKDQFDYEVVAVQAGIQNVQLSSYAASQHQPSFYWPFVVFLDQSGCVIEGVTGFKNQDRAGNTYRYAVMDGLLQLPAQTRYIFMTPLLSAVDVEDQKLSNQGQIKLTAIR
jgi:hypothetical protein